MSNLCFYQRLKTIHKQLARIKDIAHRHKTKNNRTLINVWTLLDGVMHDAALLEAIENFETKSMVFEKLRESLRIALPGGKNGINDKERGQNNFLNYASQIQAIFARYKITKILK